MDSCTSTRARGAPAAATPPAVTIALACNDSLGTLTVVCAYCRAVPAGLCGRLLGGWRPRLADYVTGMKPMKGRPLPEGAARDVRSLPKPPARSQSVAIAFVVPYTTSMPREEERDDLWKDFVHSVENPATFGADFVAVHRAAEEVVKFRRAATYVDRILKGAKP